MLRNVTFWLGQLSVRDCTIDQWQYQKYYVQKMTSVMLLFHVLCSVINKNSFIAMIIV